MQDTARLEQQRESKRERERGRGHMFMRSFTYNVTGGRGVVEHCAPRAAAHHKLETARESVSERALTHALIHLQRDRGRKSRGTRRKRERERERARV